MPHRVATCLAAFREQPTLELMLSSFENHKLRSITQSVNPNIVLSGIELELALMSYVIFIAGTSITVRRETILRSGGFTPKIRRLQDREALLKLSRHCGASIQSTVDWRKYVSEDSISRPRNGYVESLAALLEVHTDLAVLYRELIKYQVARHVLFDLIRGRFQLAWQAYRANKASAALNFSWPELMRGYRHGATTRRVISQQLKLHAQDEPTASSQKTYRPAPSMDPATRNSSRSRISVASNRSINPEGIGEIWESRIHSISRLSTSTTSFGFMGSVATDSTCER
jgi:hypothetical protein